MLTNMCMLQAMKASPQAPPHVPSLDDLKVKEGQRPRTNIDSASRKLLGCLGLTASPSLKAKLQVQLGRRLLITCITCNAALQLVRFAEGMSSEVVWVVQEAKKELKVYEGLAKAAKAEKVTINTAVCNAECLLSSQRLLWVMTCA